MAKALLIPGADRKSKWFGDRYDGLVQGVLDKLVLHSTETNKRWDCPGYGGGATAPTVTINPWRGHQKVWQHFQANESARALLNPGSTAVSENKDRVAQVEIIGYSDVKLGKAAGCYLPDLADDELRYVANVVRWYHLEWGIRLVTPPTWPWYQVSSEKAFADARMTSTEYDRFAGVLAHLHVSGNHHRDVAIDITKLLAFAGGEDDDMPTPEDIARAVWDSPAIGADGKKTRAGTLVTEGARKAIVGEQVAREAARDAAVARKLAEANAASAGPLTADDIRRISEETVRAVDEHLDARDRALAEALAKAGEEPQS